MPINQPTEGKIAAFFDVDGTIVKSTIVHYYVWLRFPLLHPLLRPFWLIHFTPKVIFYFFLDKASRSKFNRIFYRNYRGLDVGQIQQLVSEKFDALLRQKIYPAALDRIHEHRSRGDMVVLVTGSLDFIIQPLAELLQCDHALTVQLHEERGKFTGELTTAPLGDEEKARAIEAFAVRHGVDLTASYAYGDSIADLPMLRCVNHPVAVNPGKTFRRIALESHWEIQDWKLHVESRARSSVCSNSS